MKRQFIRQNHNLAVILVLTVLFCQIFPAMPFYVNAAGYEETVTVAVREIDLGDYQSQMTVGEKQLLMVTVLPEEAADQAITYTSSDPQVASINGMGRITALSEGVTDITAACGGISEKFTLHVINEEDTSVRDIDLGDCPKEIEVGTSQLLSVTIIPEEAASQKVTYESSNKKIATVNEIGRVEGIAKGKVTITICCGGVEKKLSLKVVETKSDEVPVTDIEIGDYEDELEVDKTMTLSVTVLPADATNSTVTYKSSNEKIATVNSSGEVKGISEGEVTITVSAGKITKKVHIKVKTATSKIELNTTYLVMQQGESYVLKATVYPAEADQKVEYESLNTDIISVTGNGVVNAKQCGTGTVIVKNSDTSIAVTVIVNAGKTEENTVQPEREQEVTKEEYVNIVSSADYPVISSDMLRYFYRNGTVLTIYGTDYTLRIDGKQIRNYDNEFYTRIDLKQEAEGISFELNENKKLCGMVSLQFDDNTLNGKYVYLYNTAKEKYELLDIMKGSCLELDTSGKYLLTAHKLSTGKIKIAVLIIAGLILIILAGVYIGVKKQYWFW